MCQQGRLLYLSPPFLINSKAFFNIDGPKISEQWEGREVYIGKSKEIQNQDT